MQRGYNNDAFHTEDDASQRRPRRTEDRYQPPGRRRVDPHWDGGARRLITREKEGRSRGPLSRDRDPYVTGWRGPESGRENPLEERFHSDMPRREKRVHDGANYHVLEDDRGDHRRRGEEDEVRARFQEYSHRGPDQRHLETERQRGSARDEEYGLREMAPARDRHGERHRKQRGREEMAEREPRGGFPYTVNRKDEYDEYGGEFLHQPYIPAFRSPDDVDSRQQERWEEPREGRRYDKHRTSSEHWAYLQQMLPSQMDRNKGTLRFRGTLRGSVRSRRSSQGEPPAAEPMPTTEEEVVEALDTLREQPWHMGNRRKRRQDLRKLLERTHKSWYSTRPVTSIVQQGSNSVKDFLRSIDPLRRILKRIEGRHGTSVVAVFNFLREMIQLNILLLLLLLGGIVIPSSYFVDDETDVQGIAWRVNGTSDSCDEIDLDFNNQTKMCNGNYTGGVQEEVDNADGNFINLVGDFLQGTGFLEWTFLFSGRYPASVQSENYNLSLAYILTILVVYFISLVYVIYFVAKFLRQPSASPMDYGMTFSNIIFTGWDFTVSEENAAKIERNLTICEVKTAFDDADYKTKQESFTKSDRIKLYLTRVVINFITLVLIGGGWVAIYFLVIEAENHTGNNLEGFLWEYAPTILVAAFNFIYPLIFDFVVEYEHYTGRSALLLTLGRCVFVRLTSLGILVITTLSVIYSKDRSCAEEDEYICWETQMGKQVYSVLVLDTLIQIGMTFVVNVLRRALYRFDNKLCKTVGRIEFYVPGHVLDVVYMQTLCWIGVLYAPLLSGVGLIAFFVMFLLKLFTVTVTCFPATRVFRASRSSAMFMTILSLAFLMCVVSNGMALLLIKPSLACSPFRGLDYAWEALTYNICQLTGSSVSWIRVVLFSLDDMGVALVLFVVVILLATYYVSLVKARGSLIQRLENKLKIMTKEKNFLLKQYNSLSADDVQN